MPPKRNNPEARPYGRQLDGQTIKTLSLGTDVVAWAQQEADRLGISFSQFVAEALTQRRESSALMNEDVPPYGIKKRRLGRPPKSRSKGGTEKKG